MLYLLRSMQPGTMSTLNRLRSAIRSVRGGRNAPEWMGYRAPMMAVVTAHGGK